MSLETRVEVTQNVTTQIQLFFYNASSLAPLTGLQASDFSPLSVKKSGSGLTTFVLDGVNFVELANTAMPGVYQLTLPDTLLSNLGETVLYFPALTGPGNATKFVRVDVKEALPSVDLTSVTSSLDEIKGTGFDTATHSLKEFRDSASTRLEDLEEFLLRSLGLSQENIRINNHVYNSEGLLTQSTLTIYPSRDDLILSQNARASYTMLATYDSEGRVTDYSVRLNP